MQVFAWVIAIFLTAAVLRVLTPPAALAAGQWEWISLLALAFVHLTAAFQSFNARYAGFTNSLFWLAACGAFPLAFVVNWPVYAGIFLPNSPLPAELTAILVILTPITIFYAGPLRAAFSPRSGDAQFNDPYFFELLGMFALLAVGVSMLAVNLAEIDAWYDTWRGYIAVLHHGDQCAANLNAPGCQLGFQLWEIAPWMMTGGQVVAILLIALPKNRLLSRFFG